MIEIWKKIKNYEELYEVSNLGRVRSLPRICRKLEGKEMKEYVYAGKILKPFNDRKGYLSVRLYRNDKTKDMKVHRLVCQAFLPNPGNLPQINHKDEVKSNNVVTNLEWCSALYNRNFGTRRTSTNKPVAQIGPGGEVIKKYESQNEAARALGIHQAAISHAIKNNKPTAGFLWLAL